jgi:hypothetical protein
LASKSGDHGDFTPSSQNDPIETTTMMTMAAAQGRRAALRSPWEEERKPQQDYADHHGRRGKEIVFQDRRHQREQRENPHEVPIAPGVREQDARLGRWIEIGGPNMSASPAMITTTSVAKIASRQGAPGQNGTPLSCRWL